MKTKALNPLRSAVFLAVLSLGCGLFPTGVTFTDGGVVLVADIDDEMWPSDALFIDSLKTTFGGKLGVDLTFGGGCANHPIALLVETRFAESAPPMLRARLTHDAHGDMCRALLTRHIEFDLAIVRAHYRKVYGPGAGTLVLDVKGAPIVAYSFP